jgi:hypothetical protein
MDPKGGGFKRGKGAVLLDDIRCAPSRPFRRLQSGQTVLGCLKWLKKFSAARGRERDRKSRSAPNVGQFCYHRFRIHSGDRSRTLRRHP